MTKFKSLASTKTINSSNSKAATRGYKMVAPSYNRCPVSVVVRGKEIGIATFHIAGNVVNMLSVTGNVTPADIYEAKALATRYFTLMPANQK